MISKKKRVEVIESRWRSFSERPRSREVFVGRFNGEVWNTLFLMKENGDVVYMGDKTTILSKPWDWFTHWMHVGELIEE